MSGPDFGDVDILKELRLRRWARENYVPAEDRPNSWHPIVLDEMSAKDAEALDFVHGASAYVPLVPSAVHFLHGAHDGHSRPEIAHRSEECEVYFPG